jgi:hypothetical protein
MASGSLAMVGLIAGLCVLLVGHAIVRTLFDVGEDDALEAELDASEFEHDGDAERASDSVDANDGLQGIIGGQTDAVSDVTMTTPGGRTFSGTELQTVERAREHCLAHPAASPRELVAVSAPTNSVAPDEVGAYWRDVIRPGLAGLSDVDVEAIESNDGSDVTMPPEADGVDRDAGDANAGAAMDVEESNADATDDPAPAPENDGDRAVQTAALDTGTLAPAREASEGVEADVEATEDPILDLDGAFDVSWVVRDEEHATVAGRGHAATFAIVDRDGDLAVRPLGAGYRTDEDVPQDWYVDAANALEDALPDAYAALDAPESAWTDAVEADRRAVDGADGPDVTTLEVRDDRHRVAVHGTGDRRAELLVGDDGAAFVDPDARLDHGEYWAVLAEAAAERHVRFD